MVELVYLDDEAPDDRDFVVVVEPDGRDSKALELDTGHARFRYGPQGFTSCSEAVRIACHWADQYAVDKVYVRLI